jgi:dTDP-glucose 4,6-dehydratase
MNVGLEWFMKLLVTGGMGFIGSNFIRSILTNHDDVNIVNLDRLSHGSHPANLQDIKQTGRYSFVKGDINDFELVRDLAKDREAVVNFAAETHVDRSISNPRVFHASNTAGVVTLLEVCRFRDLKILQVSTDEVYGSAPGGRGFSEGDRLEPSSPYSASKAAADLFITAYHKTYGLATCITRSTNNFGPYQSPEKFIPKAIIRASLGLRVPIYGSGRQVRDWIYVEDHCEALDLILQAGQAGEIYNMAGGNQLENLDVIERILRILRKPDSLIEHVEDRPGHDFRYSLNASKAMGRLGWRPKHSFQDALAQTVAWYLENEPWWRPLIDDKVLSPTPWKESW